VVLSKLWFSNLLNQNYIRCWPDLNVLHASSIRHSYTATRFYIANLQAQLSVEVHLEMMLSSKLNTSPNGPYSGNDCMDRCRGMHLGLHAIHVFTPAKHCDGTCQKRNLHSGHIHCLHRIQVLCTMRGGLAAGPHPLRPLSRIGISGRSARIESVSDM
jgi:hypothetical protein